MDPDFFGRGVGEGDGSGVVTAEKAEVDPVSGM